MGAMATAHAEQDTPVAQEQRSEASGRWPAPGTIRGQWTAKDLASLPDNGLRYEIIDGLLIVTPAPTNRHQWVLATLFRLLDAACEAPLRVAVAPFNVRISDDTVVQPDALVVPAPAHIDDAIGTPVLVVEVTSPSTARIDRTIKFQRYAEAGVAHYWIVNPGNVDNPPAVEVYDLTDGAYVLQGHASGAEELVITGPVPLTFAPETLIQTSHH